MREIDGIVYYKSGDISALIMRSRQTVVQWSKLSDYRELEHRERFIPKPILVNGQRLFTKEQAREIRKFSESKKNGELARIKKEYEAKKKAETKQEKKQIWAVDNNKTNQKKSND